MFRKCSQRINNNEKGIIFEKLFFSTFPWCSVFRNFLNGKMSCISFSIPFLKVIALRESFKVSNDSHPEFLVAAYEVLYLLNLNNNWLQLQVYKINPDFPCRIFFGFFRYFDFPVFFFYFWNPNFPSFGIVDFSTFWSYRIFLQNDLFNWTDSLIFRKFWTFFFIPVILYFYRSGFFKNPSFSIFSFPLPFNQSGQTIYSFTLHKKSMSH